VQTSEPLAAASSDVQVALPEPWVTKRQLAAHLRVTPRWVELQQRDGLPHLRMGRMNRYRISAGEAWLRERGISTPVRSG
jgi:hypothetical protein